MNGYSLFACNRFPPSDILKFDGILLKGDAHNGLERRLQTKAGLGRRGRLAYQVRRRDSHGRRVSAPPDIVNALCPRYLELENVTLISGITMYMLDVFKPEIPGPYKLQDPLYGPTGTDAPQAKGNVEPISYHLSLSDEMVFEGQSQRLFLRGDAARSRGLHEPGPHRRL